MGVSEKIFLFIFNKYIYIKYIFLKKSRGDGEGDTRQMLGFEWKNT